MTESPLHIDSPARSNIFHPLQTPSTAAKSIVTIATPYTDAPYFSNTSNTYSRSRKRSRHDSWSLEIPESTAVSPVPFANMDYRLAGGIDTPTAVASQVSVYDTTTPDLAFRRGRMYDSSDRNDYFHQHGGENIRGMPGKDGNGRAPKSVHQPVQYTWGSLVFGLAGKVFDFCTAGNFRGFLSGGGKGYVLATGSRQVPTMSPSQGLEDGDLLATPTASSSELDTEDLRAAKRPRRGGKDGWVMVQRPLTVASYGSAQSSPQLSPAIPRNPSPSRRPTTASTVTVGNASKRPIENLRRTTSTRTASSAGLRSPNTPNPYPKLQAASTPSRRNSIKSTLASPQSSRISPVKSPGPALQCQISESRLHQAPQIDDHTENSLARVTRKHIDKVRKKEMVEDLEIMRMNKQLKDLIKQGREALGTRIEVDVGEQEDW